MDQVYELPTRSKTSDRTVGVKRRLEETDKTNLEGGNTLPSPPSFCFFEDKDDSTSSNKVQSSPTIQPIPVIQRYTWNKKQIDTLARSSEVYEKLFGANLKTWLGDEYEVKPHDNKFNRHDFYVSKKSNPSRVVWIELECGVTQDQWQSNINENRKRWVQGLNVVSRKIAEGKHFDVFIKHNKACNSFFAASYDFIKKNGKVIVQSKNSLKFKTDNTIYALPWTCVGQSLDDFVTDDPQQLKKLLDRYLI